MSFILDLMLPSHCASCHRLGATICSKCARSLVFRRTQCCIYCSRASLHGYTHPACRKQDGVDGFISILFYNSVLARIILQFKYRLSKKIWAELATTIYIPLCEVIHDLQKLSPDIELVAMPLSPSRRRERGFNQAEVIADYLIQLFALQKADVLERVNAKTVPQASLPHTNERFHNIRGAFALKDGVQCAGRHFLLVDDVVTTGATVREAARVLGRAGAASVAVFSLAKG